MDRMRWEVIRRCQAIRWISSKLHAPTDEEFEIQCCGMSDDDLLDMYIDLHDKYRESLIGECWL